MPKFRTSSMSSDLPALLDDRARKQHALHGGNAPVPVDRWRVLRGEISGPHDDPLWCLQLVDQTHTSHADLAEYAVMGDDLAHGLKGGGHERNGSDQWTAKQSDFGLSQALHQRIELDLLEPESAQHASNCSVSILLGCVQDAVCECRFSHLTLTFLAYFCLKVGIDGNQKSCLA